MTKEVQVWTIKDNYRLGNDINSKVLAFAFGLSAEIERNLISQRTKEALARMKSEGIHVGRPRGAKNKIIKLTGKNEKIFKMLKQGVPKIKIARECGVHRSTLRRFLKEIETKKKKRVRFKK
jgi:DNA invertase Pin-like site-specific DNA recombinase